MTSCPKTGTSSETGRLSRSAVERMWVSAYRVPTDGPESDGTLEWDHTTLILVTLEADGIHGMGYSYAHAAAVEVLEASLKPVVLGESALSPPMLHEKCVRAVRNFGRQGIAAMAISALDTALWDLKARLLDVPLVALWGQVRDSVAVYGSGGFTSYPVDRLRRQMLDWVRNGISRVKMKVGRHPKEDAGRVREVRKAIGEGPEIFVDANGAYSAKEALFYARAFASSGVSWFEEPVPSEDLDGLRFIRRCAPENMEIAAGEYGYSAAYFRRMLEAGCVDVLQADATRCSGFTGLFRTAALCASFHVPLSTHTAPALHVHAGCALGPVRHLEYFHDHVRIESMFFDGAPTPQEGFLAPDLSKPGLGLSPKSGNMQPYLIRGRQPEIGGEA